MRPLTDDVVDNIADAMAKRLSDVETAVLRMIGRRVRLIGELMPSDATKLARMRELGADIAQITQMLAKATELNTAELETIYAAAATTNQLFAARFYAARNLPMLAYTQNATLQNIVKAQARITAGSFANISQTTVMAGGGLDRDETFVPISQAYRRIVDTCITTVQSGLGDYNSAVRDSLALMARGGIRTVEYASGHKRRLDSAVRMNIIDGVRAVNQAVAEQMGKEYGADGVELSAHMTCAPDHLPMQGRQFSTAEFDNLQNERSSRSVDGRQYLPIKRRIGTWNCRHFAYPIIIGVSTPTHSDEQLDKLIRDNETAIEIAGKQYTPYEASQLMRQLETQIRKAKNEAVVFGASGDATAANAARNRVSSLTLTYKAVAEAANMRMKYTRLRTPGYR